MDNQQKAKNVLYVFLVLFTGVIAVYSFFNFKIFNELKEQNRLTREKLGVSQTESTLMLRPYLSVKETKATVIFAGKPHEFWRVRFLVGNDRLTLAEKVRKRSWFDDDRNSSYDTPETHEFDGIIDISPRNEYGFVSPLDKALINQFKNTGREVFAHLKLWYDDHEGTTHTTTTTARIVIEGKNIRWEIIEHNIE